MNRLIIISLLILGVTSCKKGEEDPAFSLLSRKARISGEWKLSSLQSSSSTNWKDSQMSYSSSITKTATETSLKETIFITSPDRTITSDWSIQEYTMTIDKDGTWSQSIVADISTVESHELATTTNTFRMNESYSGTWSFVGKTKNEYKNKERVLMNTTMHEVVHSETSFVTEYSNGDTETETIPAQTSKRSFSAGEESKTYDIVMLKSKEMKWSKVKQSKDEMISPDEETAETSDYSASETIVWKAK